MSDLSELARGVFGATIFTRPTKNQSARICVEAAFDEVPDHRTGAGAVVSVKVAVNVTRTADSERS